METIYNVYKPINFNNWTISSVQNKIYNDFDNVKM